MFGRLHIEQCLVTHGQFIEGSGLREILDAYSLATIGVGAVVDVNQIKRGRYSVQLTLCSLYGKLVDAVKADGSTLHPRKWLEEKSLSSSMAHYWSLVINLQIEILVFDLNQRRQFSLICTIIKESFKVVFFVRSY